MNDKSFEALLKAVGMNELVSGTLSSPWQKEVEGLQKISMRLLMIKDKAVYQVTEHYLQQVRHRNLNASECMHLIKESLPKLFKQGIFDTRTEHFHILVNKQKQMTVIKKRTKQKTLVLAHNRPKRHPLPEGTPVPFLVALGVMNEQGKVRAKKYDKFRQINRFVEMVKDVIDDLPKGRCIEIVDFGCGKSYLTFALYHYLRNIERREINITGLDLKREVIEDCQALAKKLNYESLTFKIGDINEYQPEKKVDMVVSLHACDTATDAALEKAVRWMADVILCVPCCQQELYSQVHNESLKTLLRHGILKERFAALVTDAARAEILTALGYDVKVVEFIEMEHTPKNLLLRAVKAPSEIRQRHALERYRSLKEALHISPSLERRFAAELEELQRKDITG